ncbi:MAG TPA: hypothetical protein VG890_05320, partial [Puia sp.]|nr:hypothetical protein [Puia sp.]
SILYDHAENIRVGIDVGIYPYDSSAPIGNDILLLLDEGDNAFHPQWKKEYVKNLRTILPLIFPNYKIQVIITSHDPLTLSDLPKNNVVFLERGSEGTVIGNSALKRTFGANIADLLKDSFFLEDGMIGSFSADVINKIISDIEVDHYSNNRRREIERIIEAIDEPIIKFKLAEKFGAATGNTAMQRKIIDDEITRLQARRSQI